MKRKHYLLIAALSLSLTTTVAAATLTACGDDDETSYVQIKEDLTGTYYFDENGAEKTIEIKINSFVLNFGEGEKFGSYVSYEDGTVSLLFDNAETATAVFNSGILTLYYNGRTYTLYAKTSFTVSFDVDGGSAVAAQSVTNGRRALRPANPTKTDSVFIGWYEDNAYTKQFDFDTVITRNVTVYAKFVVRDASFGVYKAEFDLGNGIDASYPAVETVNRVLYNLPEAPSKDGNRFLGWWISNYYDGEKLSTKYKGQEIFEDTVLYAVWESDKPAVSVTPGGAEWTVKGANKMFDVAVKDSRGNVLKTQQNASTSVEFDFGAEDAGDYTVEVTVDGQTSVAYYKNKALARVSGFSVEDDFLAFDAVEAGDKYLVVKYYLDLDCGEAGHTHVHEALTATGYDFSNCRMKAGGITFKITAEAVGYAASVSEEFTLERGLEKVTGLSVDEDNDKVVWNAVENAKSYDLLLTPEGGGTVIEKTVKTNSFDMRSLKRGNWTIKVTPSNNTYNTPEAEETVYNKVRLPSPANLAYTDTEITWDAVEGATGYTLFVNDAAQPDLTTNSFTIPAGLFDGENTEYKVTVVALGATDAEKSLASDAVYIHDELGAIDYTNGVVSWNAVKGIQKYGVKVGDAEEIFVTNGTNRANVTFTKSGVTVITVTCYVNGDEEADSNTTEVAVYAVIFDTLGGTKIDRQYKAAGDTLTLPETEPARLGYEFVGWYDREENGAVYADNSPFDADKPTVYARWKANKYNVNLIVGENGTLGGDAVTSFEVAFGSSDAIYPVPQCKIEGKEFLGWFTAENGGVQITDNSGYAAMNWNIAQDTTLYAQWGYTGVSYVLSTNGKEYYAAKGEGITSLNTVTVLANYKGLPVTAIAADAFDGCATVTKLRIPSSLRTIFFANDGGPYLRGSSFYGMDCLEEVEVYDVGGERFFDSVDGVLYSVANDALNALVYVPKSMKTNRRGTFTVADGAKSINCRALSGMSLIEEIVIPSSVTLIEKYAFTSNSKLQKITFLPTANGELGDALVIENMFEYTNESVVEITFPKRLASLGTDATNKLLSLKNIYVQELGDKKDRNTNYYDLDGVLCKADELISYPAGRAGAYTTPSGIARIGEKAFSSSKDLTSVKFIASVTYIGIEAFSGCLGLRTINFDQHAANDDLTIDEKAFYGCSAVRELVLPPNLRKLGKGAFGGCNLLFSVTVKADRESLDYADGAFATLSGTGAVLSTYVQEVTFGAGVSEMNIAGVFGAELEKVTVDPDNEHYFEADGVIFNSALTSILFFPDGKTEFVAPDNMKTITGGVFRGKTTLTSVTIGTGVTTIEDSAFEGCSGLRTVIVKEGGTEKLDIGNRAFYQCSSLETIEFNGRGGAPITIGDYAFAGNSADGATALNPVFEEITLPEGVKSIGRFAFDVCARLKVVNLPASLETIGMLEEKDRYPWNSSNYNVNIGVANVSIFRRCGQIESVNVAEGGEHYSSRDGVLFAKENGVETTLLYAGWRAPGGLMPDGDGEYGYLEVPETVTEIADFAFYNNGNALGGIKKIVFKGDRTSFKIGNGAFQGATKLESIVLPSGMTTLGEGLFNGCSRLTEIEIPNTVNKILQKAFAGCATLEKVTFTEGNDTNKLDIEDGVLLNGNPSGEPSYYTTGAFYACTSLKEVKFPQRLRSIGNYTFGMYDAKSSMKLCAIQKVEIPVTAERIGYSAFKYCTRLNEVKFTGSVTDDTEDMTIEIDAFRYCDLATFTLPANVVSIGDNAFANTKITALALPARLETLGKIGLTELTSLSFSPTANSNLREIAAAAFKDMSRLTSVDLEKCASLTAIPEKLFANSGLTSVKIPASVTEIGVSAFDGSKNLKSVDFLTDADGKSKVAAIGDNAFRGTALEKFEFPTLATGSIALGACLFENCGLLTDLKISASVKELGSSLSKAPNLQNFEIDEASPVIVDSQSRLILGKVDASNNTYKVISAYSAVVLDDKGTFAVPETYNGGTINEIGDSAFAGQNAMKKVVLHNKIQKIGNYAFDQCRMLQEVQFEGDSTCLSVGEYAFRYTISLKSIALPNSVKEIGQRCFQYSMLETVTMPDVLTKAGWYMFDSCVRLTTVNNFPNLNITTVTNYDASNTFSGCISLTEVSFASGATKIPSKIFSGCKGLERIDLTGITELINTAGKVYCESPFYNCSNLNEIVLDAGLTTLAVDMFYGCSTLTTVYRSDTAEENRVENKVDLSQITGVQTYSSCSGLFYQCYAIETVDVRNMKTFGGKSTFNYCSNLRTVTLAPSGYGTLASNMFQNCTALKTVNYWNGTSIVGNDNEVTLQDSITFLGTYTFANSGIEKITIPNGVTLIGSSATAAAVTNRSYVFEDCAQLREVVLPSGLTKLGAYVFQNCASLDTIKVRTGTGEGATITGDDQKITLPAGLVSVGNYCFQNCKAITEIDLSKVATLGTTGTASGSGLTYAPTGGLFFGCENLRSVALHPSLTTIGASMFAFCTRLETIALPASLVYIQPCAFYGSGIKEITIPETVTYIGTNTVSGTSKPAVGNVSYVFAKCENLETVNVSANLQYLGGTYTFLDCTRLTSFNIVGTGVPKLSQIGNYTFKNCSALRSITLPNITTIGTDAFNDCTSIEEVTINTSGALTMNLVQGSTTLKRATILATSIPENLFDGCTALETVVLGSGLTAIGNSVFSGCTSLKAIYRSDTKEEDRVADTADLTAITSIGANAFQNCNALKSVKFNDDMTSIGATAFYNCSSLDDVTLPSKLVSLSNQVFLNCSSLSALEIPAGVTSLGTNLFVGCNSLSLTVAAANETFEINANGWLVNKDGTVLYIPRGTEGAYTTEVNFAEGASLYGYMFNGYSNVESITLPGGLTEIPAYAFWGFKGSFGADFAIPQGVTSIGDGAFQNSTITELVIPEGVTSIGNYAFSGSNITKITLPSTLTSIGTYAFRNCENLTEIVIPAGVTAISNYAFSGSGITKITLPTTIKTIGDRSFQLCPNLTELAIPEGVTSIGSYAFSGSGITNITLPSTLTSLGEGVFWQCASLDEVVIPAGITTLPSSAFSESGLTKITLPTTLLTIGTYAFKNTGNLGEVVIPAGVTSISNYAFVGSGITKITFPLTLTSIGQYAFQNCVNLETVVYTEPETAPASFTLGNYAFSGCSQLASVPFADRVTSIGQYAFQNCTALASFAFGDGLTSIGTYAFLNSGLSGTVTLKGSFDTNTSLGNRIFMDCAGIEAFVFDTKNIVQLTTDMFAGCTSLKSVNIPYTVTSFGTSVFQGCVSLSSVVFDKAPEGTDEVALSFGTGGASLTGVSTSYFYYYVDNRFGGDVYYYGIFAGCAALKTIELPSRIATIPTYCFVGAGLESVVIPESVTAIKSSAFMFTKLKSVSIPYTVATLESNAFGGCSELTTVVFEATPEGAEEKKVTLGGGADSAALATSSVYYDEEGQKYYSGAFAGCTKLKNVTLTSRVTTGKYSFAFAGIEKIDIAGAAKIGEGAFLGCKLLSEVTISDGTTEIGERVFKGCSALSSLTIPESVVKIGANFASGTGIREIYIPVTTKCLVNAFGDWTEEQSIYIDVSNSEYRALSTDNFWIASAFATAAKVEVYLPDPDAESAS